MIKNVIQHAPLNLIAFGQVISDYNNQMITLSELPFPLKEARFGKLGLLKLPILIIFFLH
jgi:hypothetical protein